MTYEKLRRARLFRLKAEIWVSTTVDSRKLGHLRSSAEEPHTDVDAFLDDLINSNKEPDLVYEDSSAAVQQGNQSQMESTTDCLKFLTMINNRLIFATGPHRIV